MIGGWAFRRELQRWSAAGHRLELWWRDDDAREPAPELDRLLNLAARHGVPLALAVIPDGDRSALAARLADERLISVIQHGIDHANVARAGEPHYELPADCPPPLLTGRLVAARARLAVLPRFTPVFAPPWNAIHAHLPAALRAGGYVGLSGFGGDGAGDAEFRRIDTHLDLMRWRGRPRFRGADAFLARATRLARARRHARRWNQPIGLLTHHLDHDEPAWLFLDTFLALTAAPDAVRWRGIADLAASPPHDMRLRVGPETRQPRDGALSEGGGRFRGSAGPANRGLAGAASAFWRVPQ